MSTPASAERIVIVGGGFSGLVASALLARDGHQVTVIERHAHFGGRAGRWEREGFRFDTGPSWFLMREVYEHTYRMLGTTLEEQLDLRRLDPAYRVHFASGAAPVEISGDVQTTLDAFEAIEPGAGKALEDYLASGRDAADLSVRGFLYNRFTSLRSVGGLGLLRAAPGMAGLLLTTLERRIARSFTDPRLRQILGYPAVFLGTRPEKAPAIYHLMSHYDMVQGVFWPRGGFAAVVDSFVSLARTSGVELLSGVEAHEIELDADGRARAVRTSAGTIDADRVVLACDAPVAKANLIPSLAKRTRARWAKKTPGPGTVLVLLGVRGKLPQLTHHTLLFAEDWKANFDAIFDSRTVPTPASSYVCMPSASDDTVAPEGHENLFLLVPVPSDPDLGRGGEGGRGDAAIEQIADAAIADLAAVADIPDLAERIVVRRTIGPGDFADDLGAWQGTALGPAHTLRQSAMLRGSVADPDVANLSVIGSSTVPGIGVPMCLISAELLLKQVRGDESASMLPEPPQVEAEAGTAEGERPVEEPANSSRSRGSA